jgi:hypothetical protein
MITEAHVGRYQIKASGDDLRIYDADGKDIGRVDEATLCELAYQNTRGKRPHWHIEPRFTGGSPAMISLGEVAHVAAQEAEARERCATGVMGAELKAKAEQPDALKGIAYGRWEKGNKVFRFDLLTGETFEEPKRLTWDERSRLLCLREWKAHYVKIGQPMREVSEAELSALEYRAKIHREVIR